MNKQFSLATLAVSYGLSLGIFILLCPEGETWQGLVFQVIVLVLASEAWNFLWWLPSLFLMFRAAKQLEEEKRYGKIAKLTSPILLVVPLLIYLAMMGLNTILPSGSNCRSMRFCGYHGSVQSIIRIGRSALCCRFAFPAFSILLHQFLGVLELGFPHQSRSWNG